MKSNAYIHTGIALMLLTFSCKNEQLPNLLEGEDVKAMQAKKSELQTQIKNLEGQIALLDSVIEAKKENKNLPLVTALVMEPTHFEHFIELQGDVTTRANVLVYPEMAGTLERIYVQPGQRVSKGQLLATIDDGGLSNQLAQLRTQSELAKTTFERQKRLWEQNIGSEIQYLQAKAQFEAQENAVKQLEKTVGKASVRAPFSGIVDDVIKDQGTVVAPGPGSELFRIVNLSDMYVEVEVPETHLGSIQKGKKSRVYFPVLGKSFDTEVRQTGNFINPANRSFKVEVPVPSQDGSVKPNLTAKVYINDYSNTSALMIPQSIVSENADGDQYVFLVENNNGKMLAKKTIIKTGKTQEDLVEVLSGINKGDQIIEEGARSVRENQEVSVDKGMEITEKTQ